MDRPTDLPSERAVHQRERDGGNRRAGNYWRDLNGDIVGADGSRIAADTVKNAPVIAISRTCDCKPRVAGMVSLCFCPPGVVASPAPRVDDRFGDCGYDLADREVAIYVEASRRFRECADWERRDRDALEQVILGFLGEPTRLEFIPRTP